MVRDSSADFLSMAISERAAEVFFPRNFIGGLRSCHRVALFLRSYLAGFFGVLLVPKRFPVFLGLQNSWKDCFVSARIFLESLLPEFLSRLSEINNVSCDILPDLQRDYFGVFFPLHYVEEEIIK